MEVKDKLKVEIVDLSYDGLGVAKVDGYIIFVDECLVGEKVLIEITDLGKNYGFAKKIDVLKPSPYREKPKCPHFGICGSCELMHLDYKQQLMFKKKVVVETIKKVGHIDELEIDKIVGMDNPYNYRNKIQMPFAYNKKAIFGYYKKKSHEVVSIEKCYLQPDEMTEIVKFIKNLCNEYNVSIYNEITGKGILRHVLVRKNYKDEFMVVLITNGSTMFHIEDIVQKVVSRYPNVKSIYQNINMKKNNVILGEHSKLLFGQKTLEEKLCDLYFDVSYQSFFQVNREQTEKLYNLVLEYADANPKTSIIDAYCGVGTISLMLAKKAKFVYGIEVVKEAIINANANAKKNQILNTKFIVGKVEDKINDYVSDEVNTIVVDPPRKGLDQNVVKTLLNSNIKRIVYVSCNPTSLARDLNLLKEKFEIKKCSIVDMFCQTVGVETVVLLSHKSNNSKVNVNLNFDNEKGKKLIKKVVEDVDSRKEPEGASYPEIKEYILNKYNVKVSSLNIAQIKTKYGIIERECYNKPKSENSRQPNCTKEKEEMIVDALKHFKMI